MRVCCNKAWRFWNDNTNVTMQQCTKNLYFCVKFSFHSSVLTSEKYTIWVMHRIITQQMPLLSIGQLTFKQIHISWFNTRLDILSIIWTEAIPNCLKWSHYKLFKLKPFQTVIFTLPALLYFHWTEILIPCECVIFLEIINASKVNLVQNVWVKLLK